MEITSRKKVTNNLKWKKTMLDDQIKNFIMFYERLTKHMLRTLTYKASTVVQIDKKHRLKSIKFN
tara:strand:- start:324 stop:518 length:195 start_codon:yes stop_codon:yes gene_type:complete